MFVVVVVEVVDIEFAHIAAYRFPKASHHFLRILFPLLETHLTRLAAHVLQVGYQTLHAEIIVTIAINLGLLATIVFLIVAFVAVLFIIDF